MDLRRLGRSQLTQVADEVRHLRLEDELRRAEAERMRREGKPS